MSFWTKEGEVGNSQVIEKDQTFCKYIPTWPPTNSGTQKGT